MLTLSRPGSRTRALLSLTIVCALTASLLVSPSSASKRIAPRRAAGANAAPRAATTSTVDDASAQTRAQEAYGKHPLQFEPNVGQTDERVRFITRANGATVFLTQTEAVFVLRNADSKADGETGRVGDGETGATSSNISPSPRHPVTPSPQSAALRMKIEGASEAAQVAGEEKLPGVVNYFIGDDPAHWHANIPTFARVRYTGVYEGVDLEYYGTAERQLEYDFRVAPGADHSQVALSFEGADSLRVEEGTGDLLVGTPVGEVRQRKPLVYQEVGGERREVESSYELKGGARVGFRVGEYDRARPLVIDPVLAYSTYLGGSTSFDSTGFDIAVDTAGNAYVTGRTDSTDFPTVNALDGTLNGGNDAFVAKLNATGSALVYSTYLGGGNTDEANGVAVDTAGNAYVTGLTFSSNFPTVNALDGTLGGTRDAFVAKLNASGSALAFSTYLGGGDDDSGHYIAVDAAGSAYVAGSTSSTNFPVANALDGTLGGTRDAFVAKLNASGSALLYSTYLGGGSSDTGFGIAVDAAGNAYVTGSTESANFPTTPGAFDTTDNPSGDAFVAKLNAAGSALSFSTYLGGGDGESGQYIAVDAAGNAYVAGATSSTDFPTANPIDGTFGGSIDAFVTKLNAAGTALAYSTYLGGSGLDNGNGIAVDTAGNAYVAGATSSTDFPTANPIDDTLGGSIDAFVAKLNAAGSALVYSTYLGGGGGIEFGFGVAVDAAGNAYVTGSTSSTDFPVTPEAFQAGVVAPSSPFVSKIGSYLIAGRVVDSGGGPVAGVTVTLSGSNSATRTTDAGGNFLFLDTTPNGSFAVTPSGASFTFNPSFFGIGNLNTNVPEIIFTGAALTPTPTPTPTPSPTPTPATFSFGAASFAVDEGAGKFQVIVTRSGDTSQPAAVDYATTDGTANDRGDYTTSIGRLRFAAGETARSFNVFVTDDAYSEGNETVQLTLSNPSAGAQVGGMASTLLTIVDNDPVNGPSNPIDATAFFVRQHYVDFLNREPDPTGFAFWTNNIDSCSANQGCREAKRIDTSAAFFLSIEFQQTGFLVERIYRAAFNRFPAFREFLRDTQEIGRGVVVGQGPWEAQLLANQQQFAADFTARSDFLAVYAGLSNEQYVDALNANTNGSLSASERNALVAGLNGATETRASALLKVAEDADFRAREFNPAFVLMEYIGYLRRAPNDPPDSDFSGFDFWLQKLNSFGGDYRRAEMVKAFLVSNEYRSRFGQP